MGVKELQALVGPSLLNADLSNLFLESKDLLEAGADPNLGAASTPLMEAAQEGHLELVQLLIKSSADVNRFSTTSMTTTTSTPTCTTTTTHVLTSAATSSATAMANGSGAAARDATAGKVDGLRALQYCFFVQHLLD